MKKNTDSAVIQLIRMVADHNQEATEQSRSKHGLQLGNALYVALDLAIVSGMRFAKDDFRKLCAIFDFDSFLEALYRQAALYWNASACESLEACLGRKPFILKGARSPLRNGDYLCDGKISRLVVGAQFTWKGESVIVKRFRDGADPAVIAYSYSDGISKRFDVGKGKVLHRYAITHADLEKARSTPRKRLKLVAAAA